jgi:hypothetical protein
VNIPVDFTHAAASPKSPIIKSSSSLPLSSQQQDLNNNNRTYGVHVASHDQVAHYPEPYSQQRPSSSYTKRSVQDLPSMTTINRPSTGHSSDRTIDKLRVHSSSPYSSQQQVSIQLDEKRPSQPITRFRFSNKNI